MQKKIIPAEIIATDGQTEVTAKKLQQLGFKILHLGSSISVQGSESLWHSLFNVAFESANNQLKSGNKGGDTDKNIQSKNMKIPPELEGYISNIAFVEPPEFF